ncbi:MAG: hypothetical protein QOE83_1672 [Actinomycetota bacterium]|jgi:hypothetical protein|nr:hypothetical protein [Actinomycetota bacterium]
MSTVVGGKVRVYRSTESLGRWLRGLLIYSVSVGAITVVLDLRSAAKLHGLERITPTLPITLIPPVAPPWFTLLGMVGTATTIVWLVWQHRSQTDLFAAGVQGLEFTPGWTVGWWFIPFANFVMPYRTMRELWRRSGAAEAEGPGSERPLRIWWGLYASALALILVAEIVLLFTGTSFSGAVITRQVSSVVMERVIIAIAACMQAAAGVVAIKIISGIDRAVALLGTVVLPASQPPGPGFAPPRPDLGAPPG